MIVAVYTSFGSCVLSVARKYISTWRFQVLKFSDTFPDVRLCSGGSLRLLLKWVITGGAAAAAFSSSPMSNEEEMRTNVHSINFSEFSQHSVYYGTVTVVYLKTFRCHHVNNAWFIGIEATEMLKE